MDSGKEDVVYLQEERGFSEAYGAFFKIARQNFGHIGQSLLFMVGPFVLIYAIIGALYGDRLDDILSKIFVYSFSYGHRIWAMMYEVAYLFVLFKLSYLVSQAFLVIVSAEYLALYEQKGTGRVSAREVGQAIWKDGKRLLGTGAVIFLLYLVGAAVVVGIFLLFIQGGPGMSVIAVVLYYIAALLLYFPLSYLMASVFNVCVREKKSGFAALARAWKLLRGSYWWTWLIFVLAMLVLLVAGQVFMVPNYVVEFLSDLTESETAGFNWEIPIMITALLGLFFQSLFSGFYFLLCGVHYYGLAEKKDRKGLANRISQIGKGQSYRDVEEEY